MQFRPDIKEPPPFFETYASSWALIFEEDPARVNTIKVIGRTLKKPLPMKITMDATLGLGKCPTSSMVVSVDVRGITSAEVGDQTVDVT